MAARGKPRIYFTFMVGCFGASGDQHHDHVLSKQLAEAHPCVSAWRLAHNGLLVPGASARLETALGGYQVASREAGKIWLDDQPVVLASHPPSAWQVFLCPVCARMRYKLSRVDGRWACIKCHGLRYASRHKHRMLTGWHRLMLLRRRIGASLVPFTSITPKPLRQRRYWRIVREIRQIEAGLIGHIREDVSDVLERRDGRPS